MISNVAGLDAWFNSSMCLNYGTKGRYSDGRPSSHGKPVMSKLVGKVAVVTGASKGIGASIARALAAEGAAVVVNYASSKAGADAVTQAITEAGGKAIAVQGDVSKAEQARGL